jgi:hypothetical protein
MQQRLAFACACLALAALIGGCSAPSQPVAPPSDSASPGIDMSFYGPWGSEPGRGSVSGFYPIALGNRWLYERNIAVQVRSGDDVSTTFQNGSVQHTQICFEDRGGRRYVVEQNLDGSGIELAVTYVRVREDRGGLHEADVSITEPGCPVFTREAVPHPAGEASGVLLARAIDRESDPARRAAFERAGRNLIDRLATARSAAFGGGLGGAGGPRAGEIFRLRYPLFPGQRWIVRASPRFSGRAEAVETLETGAGPLQAWRIRTDSEFFGPADRVYAWYGKAGFLQMSVHLESEATDEQGNPVGRLYWDELLRLEELDLVGD